MLRKKYVSCNELDSIAVESEYGIIIIVSNKDDLEKVHSFFFKSRFKIRGILISSSLIKELTLSCKSLNINYVGISFKESLDLSLLSLIKDKPDHFFLEGRVSYALINDNFDYSLLQSFQKVIIDCYGIKNLDNVETILAELVSIRKLPFLIGVPYCLAPLPLHYDIYLKKKGILHKNSLCAACALYEWCCADENQFDVVPYNEKAVQDILKYINNEENITDRI